MVIATPKSFSVKTQDGGVRHMTQQEVSQYVRTSMHRAKQGGGGTPSSTSTVTSTSSPRRFRSLPNSPGGSVASSRQSGPPVPDPESQERPKLRVSTEHNNRSTTPISPREFFRESESSLAAQERMVSKLPDSTRSRDAVLMSRADLVSIASMVSGRSFTVRTEAEGERNMSPEEISAMVRQSMQRARQSKKVPPSPGLYSRQSPRKTPQSNKSPLKRQQTPSIQEEERQESASVRQDDEDEASEKYATGRFTWSFEGDDSQDEQTEASLATNSVHKGSQCDTLSLVDTSKESSRDTPVGVSASESGISLGIPSGELTASLRGGISSVSTEMTAEGEEFPEQQTPVPVQEPTSTTSRECGKSIQVNDMDLTMNQQLQPAKVATTSDEKAARSDAPETREVESPEQSSPAVSEVVQLAQKIESPQKNPPALAIVQRALQSPVSENQLTIEVPTPVAVKEEELPQHAQESIDRAEESAREEIQELLDASKTNTGEIEIKTESGEMRHMTGEEVNNLVKYAMEKARVTAKQEISQMVQTSMREAQESARKEIRSMVRESMRGVRGSSPLDLRIPKSPRGLSPSPRLNRSPARLRQMSPRRQRQFEENTWQHRRQLPDKATLESPQSSLGEQKETPWTSASDPELLASPIEATEQSNLKVAISKLPLATLLVTAVTATAVAPLEVNLSDKKINEQQLNPSSAKKKPQLHVETDNEEKPEKEIYSSETNDDASTKELGTEAAEKNEAEADTDKEGTPDTRTDETKKLDASSSPNETSGPSAGDSKEETEDKYAVDTVITDFGEMSPSHKYGLELRKKETEKRRLESLSHRLSQTKVTRTVRSRKKQVGEDDSDVKDDKDAMDAKDSKFTAAESCLSDGEPVLLITDGKRVTSGENMVKAVNHLKKLEKDRTLFQPIVKTGTETPTVEEQPEPEPRPDATSPPNPKQEVLVPVPQEVNEISSPASTSAKSLSAFTGFLPAEEVPVEALATPKNQMESVHAVELALSPWSLDPRNTIDLSPRAVGTNTTKANETKTAVAIKPEEPTPVHSNLSALSAEQTMDEEKKVALMRMHPSIQNPMSSSADEAEVTPKSPRNRLRAKTKRHGKKAAPKMITTSVFKPTESIQVPTGGDYTSQFETLVASKRTTSAWSLSSRSNNKASAGKHTVVTEELISKIAALKGSKLTPAELSQLLDATQAHKERKSSTPSGSKPQTSFGFAALPKNLESAFCTNLLDQFWPLVESNNEEEEEEGGDDDERDGAPIQQCLPNHQVQSSTTSFFESVGTASYDDETEDQEATAASNSTDDYTEVSLSIGPDVLSYSFSRVPKKTRRSRSSDAEESFSEESSQSADSFISPGWWRRK